MRVFPAERRNLLLVRRPPGDPSMRLRHGPACSRTNSMAPVRRPWTPLSLEDGLIVRCPRSAPSKDSAIASSLTGGRGASGEGAGRPPPRPGGGGPPAAGRRAAVPPPPGGRGLRTAPLARGVGGVVGGRPRRAPPPLGAPLPTQGRPEKRGGGGRPP